MYKIIIENKIENLPKDYWNKSADHPFLSYEWLELIEEMKIKGLSAGYIMVYRDGKLIALSAYYSTSDFSNFTEYLALNRILNKNSVLCNKLLKKTKSSIVCFSPFSFFSGIGISDSEDRGFVMRLILNKLNEISKREKASSIIFLNIKKSDSQINDCLLKEKYHPMYCLLDFRMRIPWSSFEEYLKGIEKSKRKEIRRKMRRNLENKIKIEIRKIEEVSSNTLYGLYENVSKKHGHIPYALPKKYFECLKFMKNHALLFLAKDKNRKIIGFILVIRYKGAYFTRQVGFDYGNSKNTYNYFVLNYRIIESAIKNRIKEIQYGPTSRGFKIKLGCEPEPKISYIKFCDKKLNILYSALKIIESKLFR